MGNKYEIIIIGGGPAGISAALTAINRGKNVCLISNPPETSKLFLAEKVTNYPGMKGTGAEILSAMRSQLKESGAEHIEGKVLSVMPLGASIGVAVGNDFYEATAVIAAMGMGRRPLCEGETEFLGRGVSYCATCDGMLYKGKTVAVLGEGKEAEEDTEFLREIGCTVLSFSGKGKIEIKGDMKANTLVVDGSEYKTDCIFILKASLSSENLIPGIENENGMIVTDKKGNTNIKGIFAAGDCTGAPFQLAKAVGEGNTAALSACEYIKSLENKL